MSPEPDRKSGVGLAGQTYPFSPQPLALPKDEFDGLLVHLLPPDLPSSTQSARRPSDETEVARLDLTPTRLTIVLETENGQFTKDGRKQEVAQWAFSFRATDMWERDLDKASRSRGIWLEAGCRSCHSVDAHLRFASHHDRNPCHRMMRSAPSASRSLRSCLSPVMDRCWTLRPSRSDRSTSPHSPSSVARSDHKIKKVRSNLLSQASMGHHSCLHPLSCPRGGDPRPGPTRDRLARQEGRDGQHGSCICSRG